jgi:hypothetical protein
MASACRNALQGFRIHKDLPNFFMHPGPSAHYLTSPSTQPPTFSNVSTASSLTLLTSPVLHPLLPPTASITSSRWFLLRAHAADSNSTSTITYLTHFMTKSSPMLPTTSTFSQAYFLLRHPTLSSDYVTATHTTAFSTGNSTQASHVNYVSLYARLPTNRFVHVAPWLIFLVTTSSNAHTSAKLEFTIQFMMALHKLSPQFTLPLDMSPRTLQWTGNPSFTSHQTLTLVPLIFSLTHIQPHQLSHPTAAPLLQLASISPSAPYLQSFPSFLVLLMFYKLLRPMPTHIYRNANAENLVVSTKPTCLLLLLLGVTH